jgi:DNA topoisomerase-1
VTRALASTDPLSAGRVQSVALRLVVERERAIRDFQPVEHYGVQVLFTDDAAGITWPAQWDFAPLLGEASVAEDEGGGDEPSAQRALWMDKEAAGLLAQALRQATGFTVIEVQQKPQRRRPPAPFTTSTMQQAASVKLHLSPERTMELAQKLYEAGIITYHRTDNCNLSDDGVAAIREWIIGRMGNDELLAETPNHWKNKEGAQEGHEATRPTDFNRTKLTEAEVATHGEDAAALYQLIWQRAVASQLRDAVYDATKAVLRSDVLLNGEPQRFVATGRVLVEEGWMRLTKTDATNEADEERVSESEQALPELAVGLYLEHAGVELQTKKTQAPPRYTEAALVKHLEKEGVGRPSTYAAILKNITTRGYVEVKSRKIRATELGERIIDVLAGSFQFAEVQFTRTVESVLDRVAAGEFGYSSVVGKYYERLVAELGTLPPPPPKPGAEDLGFVCPKCGKPLLRRKAKKNNRHFWGCSGYPECDVTLPDTEDETGGPAPDFDALDRPKPQATEITCPKCGKGHLVRREGSRGAFYGCNKYPKCKATFEEHEGAPLIEEQEKAE